MMLVLGYLVLDSSRNQVARNDNIYGKITCLTLLECLEKRHRNIFDRKLNLCKASDSREIQHGPDRDSKDPTRKTLSNQKKASLIYAFYPKT